MKTRYTERVELHCHTNKSEGYGICDPLDILKFAKQNQMSAVEFTDYGNIIAYPEVQHLTGRMYAEIKPIYGIELLVADDLLPIGAVGGNVLRNGYPANYVLVLIKNEVGRKNLYHLLSEANLQAEDRIPWVSWSRLQEMREGLLLGSGSSMGELQCVIARKCEEIILREIAKRYDFLEVQPIGNDSWRSAAKYEFQRMNSEEMKELRCRIVALGEEFCIPVVATSDAHYLRAENQTARRVLMHKSGRTMEMEDEVYFRTTEEMLEEFAYLGEDKAYEIVVHNTNKIAEQIEKIIPVKQEKRVVRIDNADDKLRELCEQEVLRRWRQKECIPDEVRCRLGKELEHIKRSGFAVTFLHYHELISCNELKPWQYALKGKAAASLVCYLLGVSHTDPLNQSNSLYDEFFFGYEGDIEPAIELVVDEAVLDKVVRSVEKLSGVGSIVRMAHNYCMSDSNIMTLMEDYAKTYGEVPLETMDKVKLDLEGCLYRKGVPHSKGYAIIPEGIDVQNYFPIDIDYTGSEIVTHFSHHDINHQFLVYNISGSESCTLLTRLQERIKYFPTDQDITEPKFLATIPLLKRATLSTCHDAPEFLWTTEYEHDNLQEIIVECKPVTLSDYVKVKALAHGNGVWEGNGRQLLQEKHMLHDLIATPEDIYEKLMDYGMDSRTAFQIADLVRKGKFFLKTSNAVEEMRRYQVPEWLISSCEKIRYLMSRAQAVEAAKLEWRILYYKIKCPEKFDDVCSEFLGVKYKCATRFASTLKGIFDKE